jgi:pimeloyl-ACP methyl ester carboxylesterase
MSEKLPAKSSRAEVDAFLEKVRRLPELRTEGRGRLVFAMDATASRAPTWDRACRIQGEMFEATAALGGLEIQLVFYRGFAECKASRWMANAKDLHGAMSAVACVGGQTQIGRVLGHIAEEARAKKVSAAVFVGDAMEESHDRLAHLAGELGLLGVPVFVFHEGGDPVAARASGTHAAQRAPVATSPASQLGRLPEVAHRPTSLSARSVSSCIVASTCRRYSASVASSASAGTWIGVPAETTIREKGRASAIWSQLRRARQARL